MKNIYSIFIVIFISLVTCQNSPGETYTYTNTDTDISGGNTDTYNSNTYTGSNTNTYTSSNTYTGSNTNIDSNTYSVGGYTYTSSSGGYLSNLPPWEISIIAGNVILMYMQPYAKQLKLEELH